MEWRIARISIFIRVPPTRLQVFERLHLQKQFIRWRHILLQLCHLCFNTFPNNITKAGKNAIIKMVVIKCTFGTWLRTEDIKMLTYNFWLFESPLSVIIFNLTAILSNCHQKIVLTDALLSSVAYRIGIKKWINKWQDTWSAELVKCSHISLASH